MQVPALGMSVRVAFVKHGHRASVGLLALDSACPRRLGQAGRQPACSLRSSHLCARRIAFVRSLVSMGP